ncbi:U3 small nucleolar RNA-associated protein 25-like isoform X2 [Panicum miliaceum]|uniref:U3 small nucleolar RNA-associated protein 25-like isoform X2 n=1 Tax=Panicum miliaceum TaxID=4540 RepID=A0A3L6R4C6_PANMI|nr:U3 small nucleolar RNA-associated protein 25-like isoform X2 [Panicum miliaceum]
MMNKWESVEERNHAILKAKQEEKARKMDKLGADVQFYMDLAVEYGAAPDIVELFGCTLFFKDEYNRNNAEGNSEVNGNSEAARLIKEPPFTWPIRSLRACKSSGDRPRDALQVTMIV